MIEAIALAIVAVVVTTMLATAPLLAAHELDGWGPFCAAIPPFALALGQAVAFVRGKWRKAENIIGVAVLLAIAPFAAFLYQPMPQSEGVVLVVIGVILSILVVFALLAGAILKVIEPLGWVLAWGMTISAFLVSAIIPSVPPRWALWQRHPPPTYVHGLPSAGELFVEGPPLVVHGIKYRLKKPTYTGGMCMVEMAGEAYDNPTEFPYACGVRTIRCDDLRRWCLIDDPKTAMGYSYGGQLVTLYDYDYSYKSSVRDERDGNLALRVGAEILALAAAFVLFRGRDSEDRQLLSVSALVAATIGVALGIRMLI